MSLSPTALALIAVLVVGYVSAISLGTWAYFANKRDF